MNTAVRSVSRRSLTPPNSAGVLQTFTAEVAALLRAVFNPREILDEVQNLRIAQLKAQTVGGNRVPNERRLDTWVGMD